MNKRTVEVVFTGQEKKINWEMIAAVVSKTIRKGGNENDKRKEIS